MTGLGSVERVAALAGGTLHDVDPRTPVTSVVSDSRQVAPGALFVAIAGARADGHDFAADVVAAGASAVLAARPLPGLPTVVVDDPVTALGRLAAGHLAELRSAGTIDVVGVTGSSGKTSTKDLLAAVLTADGATVSAPGSFNSEVGLPLTALRAGRSTRHLVLEMGARGLGHIAGLCAIAAPDVGVVLNVGTAHLGEFGSRDAVAQAKGELAAAAQRVAVLNADDPLVLAMRSRAHGDVVTFGAAASADVRIAGLRLDESGRPVFVLHAGGQHADVTLQQVGAHAALNAAAAAAAALAVGMGLEDVAAALSQAQPGSRWRMEVRRTSDGVTVVNDAYNANPESMRAALAALAAMTVSGRRWAVLGAMGELGAAADDAHRELGADVAAAGVDRLLVVGAAAARVVDGAANVDARWVPDADAALACLLAELAPGDAVLVKASRAIGLERIALALTPDPVPVDAEVAS